MRRLIVTLVLLAAMSALSAMVALGAARTPARATATSTPTPTPCDTTTSCTLTIEVDGEGHGAVQSGETPPKAFCGSSAVGQCTVTYAPGDQVTLSTAAFVDSVFAYWGGDCIGSTSPCTLTMNGNKTVSAVFRATSTSCPSPGTSPSPTPSPSTSPSPPPASCASPTPTPAPAKWETVACTSKARAKTADCNSSVRSAGFKGYGIERESGSFEVRKLQSSRSRAQKEAAALHKAGFAQAHAEREET